MLNAEVARIRELMSRWMAAVAAGDLAGLASMMTDDVVVVHGDGRVLRGKAAVVAELSTAIARFRVEQEAEPEETIVAGEWAFDRARVTTRIVAREGGRVRDVASQTVTIARRTEAGRWLVARAIGVIEQ